MESVVLGFLKAIFPVYILLGVILTIILFKFYVRIIVKIGGSVHEVYRKGFREASEQSVDMVLAVAIVSIFLIVYVGVIYLFGIDRARFIVPGVVSACVIYFVIFIYIFFVDMQVGREKRIEIASFVNLIFIASLVIALIWDELVKAGALETVSTIAAILAGAVALFTLTIAFLNYKRKAGIAIRCNIVFDNGDRAFNLYFSNLKDKSIVIYSFAIERDNLVLEQVPEKPIILGAYGVQVFRLKRELLFFNQTDANTNSGYVDNEVFEVPILLYSHIVHGEIQIRAMTEKGEVLVDTRSIPDLSLLKGIVLRQAHYPLSQIYANRNAVEITAEDGKKIEEIESSMFLLRKKDGKFILVEKPKISENSNKTEYNQGN